MNSTLSTEEKKFTLPFPYIDYRHYCILPNYIGDEIPDETSIIQEDIETIMEQMKCTRSQAVRALKKNKGDLINALMEFTITGFSKGYNITDQIDKRGIQCIIGVPDMDESGIYSHNMKPVILSVTASEHYDIEKLEDIVGKPVVVFRRKKDKEGKYVTPTTYYLKKATIKKFNCLGRFDMAEADIIETSTGEETKSVRIQRICIDWEKQ